MPAAHAQKPVTDEEVAKLLAEVNSTAEGWSKALARDQSGDDATGDVAQAKSALAQKVSHLYSAIKGPADMIHDHLEKVQSSSHASRRQATHLLTSKNSSAIPAQCGLCLIWESLTSYL